ncbi:MAG: LacI family DNA-binding transcriptional regulator [Bacteroidetes bacterium]|nr:LacI family DNA-binding transcriptional regulator [Bacteroidota bacterium]MBS1932626.1 LacI family DNA-binding transcriptional regulator [Bacteroidota bacterium]
MSNVTIKTLAKELKLSTGTVSKALKDSHEISSETKLRVHELAKKLNYVVNPYASSLRKRKSKTIAVVLPEVADSFFSLAINGIESVAQTKGYHVLIYLTHENFLKEKEILNDFKSGRVDGVLISVTSETKDSTHICELLSSDVPVVFFDRVFDDIETAKVTTNDFESGYIATKHLIEKKCKRIIYLSISEDLSIINKRMDGFKKALMDHRLKMSENDIVYCSNDEYKNFDIIKKRMSVNPKPDGIIISVEKLTIPVYAVCKELGLKIPAKVKIVSFSNLASAFILDPALTTITQPAYKMGEAAAALLFKALEKPNFQIRKQQVVLPSVLTIRKSSL